MPSSPLRVVLSRYRSVWDHLFCDGAYVTERIGNDGSAWRIVPSMLPAVPIVVSGGAGGDISFELELLQRMNAEVFLFDPSPTGINTLQSLGELPKRLHFFPVGLAEKSGPVFFREPDSPLEGSFAKVIGDTNSISFECTTLAEIVKLNALSRVDLLKLDIEGFEYEVLDSMLADGIVPTQLAVEVHHFLPGIRYVQTIALVAKLYLAGYRLIHKSRQDLLFLKKP
jgi:FkbM family methyltransferase